jgi:hypothetical protein
MPSLVLPLLFTFLYLLVASGFKNTRKGIKYKAKVGFGGNRMGDQDNTQIELAKKLLSEEEDILFESLGEVISQQSLGLSKPTRKDKIKKGKNWMSKRYSTFSELICTNEVVKLLLESQSAERRIELAVVIADILAASFTSIPVFTVSVLLVKNGIHELCRTNHES